MNLVKTKQKNKVKLKKNEGLKHCLTWGQEEEHKVFSVHVLMVILSSWHCIPPTGWKRMKVPRWIELYMYFIPYNQVPQPLI